MSDSSPALIAATALIDALIAGGVHDVVLCPGSRSAPLAHAALARETAGDLRLHVRIDERSAAFFALGVAKAQQRAGHGAGVAIITTSGTAVANLHPAVLEAHHAHVPLLLLTADRPHELRYSGANQTTVQAGIFGPAVRFEADPPAPCGPPDAATWQSLAQQALHHAAGTATAHPGPVHLNLPLREPLNPSAAIAAPGPLPSVAGIRPAVTSPGAEQPWPVRPVIIAGADAGARAAALARATAWPLIAEPGSGACGAPSQLPAPNLVLQHPELSAQVATAIVFGRPTLARPTRALLGLPQLQVITIGEGERPLPDVSGRAVQHLTQVPANWLAAEDEDARQRGEYEAWSRLWQRIGQGVRTLTVLHAQQEGVPRLTGPSVALTLSQGLREGDALFVGSSSAARDVDDVAGECPAQVYVNRGLSGIDGCVATALGIASQLSDSARGFALLGDLTTVHDLGGWFLGEGEREPNLCVVVLNDHGGAIFAGLEQGEWGQQAGNATAYERIFATPQNLDFAALAAGLGITHRRVKTAEQLAEFLRGRDPGRVLVEVELDRVERVSRRRVLAAKVRNEVERILAEN